MQFSHYIGVDISKSTLDAAIYASEMKKADTKHVTNDAAGLKELMSWVKTNGVKPKTMVVCAEHTGVYGNALQLFCEKKGISLCLESPLQIKRSMGLVRGKNDQIDAIRIAQYAYDHREKLELFHRPSVNITTLSNLLRERRLYVRQKATLTATQGELGQYETSQSRSRRDGLIDKLSSMTRAIEKQMIDIINKDEALKKTYDLITSVVGIGPITAIDTIVYTNNFQNFSTPRQYASFIGAAPFDHTSGTIRDFQFSVLKSLFLNLGLCGTAATMRGLLSLRDVNGCATVRDLEVEGLADFHLCSDEWSDELHLAGVLYAAYGAHLGKD